MNLNCSECVDRIRSSYMICCHLSSAFMSYLYKFHSRIRQTSLPWTSGPNIVLANCGLSADTMKLSLAFTPFWLTIALGQFPECTRELAATDECADVINANACYNQFRFTDNRTLSCIGGTDDNDRARKV